MTLNTLLQATISPDEKSCIKPAPPTDEAIIMILPYPPENKPPPLFDLQVLAQVFLPRL